MKREQVLAYLAGFIDGEGSIAVGLNKSSKGETRWYLRMSAHQLNPKPLQLLAKTFGGTIRRTKGDTRDIFEWAISSKQAYDAIVALRPYLIVKADEAGVAMRFQESLHNNRRALTDDDKSIRNGFYLLLRELKRRAYET